jgi:sec-independent protein translocase protein TatB
VFDVSFSELFVIAVVALLVIGPEKLPKVARTMGAFMGRMQRYVAQVKEEVNREVRFEELQKLQEEIKQSVESNLVKPVEKEMTSLKDSIHKPPRLAETKATAAGLKAKAKPVATKRVTTSKVKPKTTEANVTKPKPSTKSKDATVKVATNTK